MKESVTEVREIGRSGIVITGMPIETGKGGIGTIIVTRTGIIEDHTREIPEITIVSPTGVIVGKDVLKIGMIIQKEEIIVIKTGTAMIGVMKDVGKEVPAMKVFVERVIGENVGIAERKMIVGIVILIVR